MLYYINNVHIVSPNTRMRRLSHATLEERQRIMMQIRARVMEILYDRAITDMFISTGKSMITMKVYINDSDTMPDPWDMRRYIIDNSDVMDCSIKIDKNIR